MLSRDVPAWADARSVPAEETARRALRSASAFGITRVADVTGLDRVGIPVVMVCRPGSRSLSVSQGKGLTLAAARASGLMESIELHHAERIDHEVRLSSYRDLARRTTVVEPTLLSRPLTSRFAPDAAIPWVRAEGLRSAQRAWVPLELVDLDSRLPRAYPNGHFAGSSNGLASGNTRDEAVIHALAEVIERDAEQLWSLTGPRERDATRIDLASVDDPTCTALLAFLDEADVAVVVMNLTSDLGVACFACMISDRDERAPLRVGPVMGSGCHPDRRLALVRAITEAAQSRLTVIAGSRDDLQRTHTYEVAPGADAIRQFVADAARPGSVAFSSVPTFESDGPGIQAHLLDAVERAGFGEPLVLDLTACERRGDCPASVVKIVAPGLEAYSHQPTARGPRARRVVGNEAAA